MGVVEAVLLLVVLESADDLWRDAYPDSPIAADILRPWELSEERSAAATELARRGWYSGIPF